jgi:hypothetical protein
LIGGFSFQLSAFGFKFLLSQFLILECPPVSLSVFAFQFQHIRFLAFKNMLPQMSNPAIRKMIRIHAKAAVGWKLSGAGDGGYMVLVSRQPVPGAIQLRIRRPGE